MYDGDKIVEKFINDMYGLKQTYHEELDHIVENNRWLTTLVLAEIWGIAAYRNFLGEASLSIFAAIIIVILSLTISCFMISILSSRYARSKVSTIITDNVFNLKKHFDDSKISLDKALSDATSVRLATFEQVSKEPKSSRVWEGIGIGLFIIGSLLAIFNVFILELMKLFNL
ncbi:hypothetical protein [Pleomorphovibrio marinus]|uniref:hypothetical protein n=1 Tax=Pleomorphovibrio marinus TaxID=2164132 RepID=UPI000E09F3BE|nr:hypothetical protein [Pleomorphovibrio marinus]